MSDNNPYTIHVHHVGGAGEAGPTGVLARLGDVGFTVYDALEEAATSSEHWDSAYHVVNKAIGEREEEATFYETTFPSASSLLKTAPSAKDYTVMTFDGLLQIWGPHTKIAKELPLKVHSIDELVGKGEVPPVDFLSIDAQGAELAIIEGAAKQLNDSVVGLILEAEYAPLYEGQPLFSDTMKRLTTDGFRLCDIINIQYFNSYPYSPEVLGDGFMTVGEAIYLKEFNTVPRGSNVRVLKLAAVAAALGRFDYALLICDTLEKFGLPLEAVAKTTGVKYVKFLSDLLAAAKVVQQESPPVEEMSEGPGFRPSLPPATQAGLPDPISRVLLDYGFKELAQKHLNRVLRYRMLRNKSKGLG